MAPPLKFFVGVGDRACSAKLDRWHGGHTEYGIRVQGCRFGTGIWFDAEWQPEKQPAFALGAFRNTQNFVRRWEDWKNGFIFSRISAA